GAARRVDHRPARPRHRQRLLRRGGEPDGLRAGHARRPRRGEGGARDPVLGLLVRRRPGRPVRRARARGRRGRARGRGRARRHHGPAPRLALPPRPPRGRLRLAHRPLPRRGALEGDARRAGAARPPPPPQPLSFSSPARPMRVETPPVLPTPSPVQLGYRMPAEWEPHTATWLTWPHCEETWPGKLE